jgi:hypothetical protein
MKYQEQLAIAQQGVQKINKDFTMDDFLANLSKEGVYASDINQIKVLLRKEFQKKYGSLFEPYLLKGQEDQLAQEFPDLAPSTIEMVKQFQITEIQTAGQRSVAKMMKEGREEEEIVRALENPFFTNENILAEVDHYIKHNVKVSGQEKQNYIVMGILLMVIALVVFLTQSVHQLSARRTLFLVITLLATGVYNLVKSRMTRAAIEAK